MNEEVLQPTEAALAEEPTLPPAEETLPTDITHRLADEFFRLREEVPAIQSPEMLPDEVLDMAADKGISLFDAYLRYRHEEEKRIRREEERRREAAARSTGSLSQGAVDSHPEQDAFLRAFRTALK